MKAMSFHWLRQTLSVFCVILCLSIHAKSATVSVPDLVSTVMSDSGSGEPDMDPDPLIDTRDLVANGNTVGFVSSVAPDLLLSSDSPDPGDFMILTNAESLRAEVDRTVNSGRPVRDVTAMSMLSIAFTLDPGETGTLNLDFSYALEDLGVSSELVYSLTGPNGAVTAFGGNFSTVTGGTSQSGVVNTSGLLTDAGIYTFKITASIPLDDVQNTQSGFVDVDGFSLSFDSAGIPEPTSITLFMLAVLCSLGRYRR